MLLNELREGEVLVDFGSYSAGVDSDIVDLVIQMNRFEGIQTLDSCSGHGKDGVWIFFHTKSLEDLPPLLYYIDSCHCGVAGWQVIVYTDCSMCPATFWLKSTSVGQEAYDEAKIIANHMREYSDSLE